MIWSLFLQRAAPWIYSFHQPSHHANTIYIEFLALSLMIHSTINEQHRYQFAARPPLLIPYSMEHSIGQEPDPLNDLAIAASIMLCRGGEAVQHCVEHLSGRYQSADWLSRRWSLEAGWSQRGRRSPSSRYPDMLVNASLPLMSTRTDLRRCCCRGAIVERRR